MNDLVISTAYLGPIEYFAAIVKQSEITIDAGEHYIKQTYRNRCEIYAASGKLSLTIPVIKINGNHTTIKDIRIAYSERWQCAHWGAVVSAYNQSPFFLYYRDEFESFYQQQFDFLMDFNLKLTEIILNFLQSNAKLVISDGYIKDLSPDNDLRTRFSPKKKSGTNFPEYIQVFSDKHGFIPNLSIIDLLFNEGPNAFDYLRNLKLQ